MLKAALDRFGDLGGVVFNRRSDVLVGGHQRVEAFKRSRAKAVVHIERHHDKPTRVGTVATGYVEVGDERFAYREVDWPEDIEMAANLAANKGAGDFDMPAVADMFSQLAGHDIDMDLTMFDVAEREKMVSADSFEESGAPPERLDQTTPTVCPSCGHEFFKS